MKIENLMEGLKFGNKEIQELKKESSRILIGIEYEFLPEGGLNNSYNNDGEFSEGEELARDELRDQMERDLQDAHEEFRDDQVNDLYLEELIGDLTYLSKMDMGELDIGTYSDPDNLTVAHLDMLKSDKELIEKMLGGSRDDSLKYDGSRRSALDDAMSMIGDVIRHEYRHELPYSSFRELYKEILTDINDSIEAIEAGDAVQPIGFNEDVASNIVVMGEFLDKFSLVTNNTNNVSSYIIDALFPYDADETAEMMWNHDFDVEFDHRASSLDMSGGGGADLEDIKEKMIDFGIDFSKIEKYHPEHADMAEFITEPMPLLQAIPYMKEMFEFIDVNGTTESYSGMHVNISIKGKPFIKDNFDVLKLFILLDQKFISEGDKYKNLLGFTPRNMVDRVLDHRYIPFSSLVIIAGSKTPDELIGKTKEFINVAKKYQQLNFNHMFNEGIERGRIEARFFGGEGYHKRATEMEWQIYRLAYMVEIAFNPDFEKKEYLIKLVKFLDKVSVHVAGVSFAEFTKQVQSGTVTKKEDVVNPEAKIHKDSLSILKQQQAKAKARDKEANETWFEFKAK